MRTKNDKGNFMLAQTTQNQKKLKEDIQKLLEEIDQLLGKKGELTTDEIKQIIIDMSSIIDKRAKITDSTKKQEIGKSLREEYNKLLEREELKDKKYGKIYQLLSNLSVDKNEKGKPISEWKTTLNNVLNELNKLNQEKTQRPKDISGSITSNLIGQRQIINNPFLLDPNYYSNLQSEYPNVYNFVNAESYRKMFGTYYTYTINRPGMFGKPMPGLFPELIPPGFQENPSYLNIYMEHQKIYDYMKNRDYTKISDGLVGFLKLTGVDISKGVVLNEADLQINKLRPDDPLVRRLDFLFKKDGEYKGRTLVFLEDKDSGEMVGYYNDNNNWFLTDIRIRNGEVISGSQVKGKIDFSSFNATFDWMKTTNKDGIGYILVNIPETGSTLYGQENYAMRQVGLAQDVGSFGFQVGYLELEPGFLGNKKEQKGASIGVYNDNGVVIAHAAGSIGGLEGYLEGVSHKTYVAGFFNKENSEKNLIIGRTQYFGKTTVSFTLNQYLSQGQDKVSGLISIDTPDWSARAAYDNITPNSFYDNVENLIKNIQNRNENTLHEFLDSFQAYLSSGLFKSAKQPEAGFELDLKKEDLGFKIFKNSDGSYTVGVKRNNSDSTINVEKIEFSSGPNSMITISGGNNKGDKFNFQLGKQAITLSIDSKNLTTTFNKIFEQNTEQVSVLYKLDNNASIGGTIGAMKGEPFIGASYRNNKFEFNGWSSNLQGAVIYIPNWKALVYDLGFNANVLGGNINLNVGQIIKTSAHPSHFVRISVGVPLSKDTTNNFELNELNNMSGIRRRQQQNK